MPLIPFGTETQMSEMDGMNYARNIDCYGSTDENGEMKG